MRAALLVAVSAWVLAGCSSLADAYERDLGLAVQGPILAFDDPSIAESFAKSGQVRFPARLAIAGVESNRYGRFDDPSRSETVAAFAQDAAHWSEVVALPGFLAGEERTAESLRRAAAR